MNVYHESVREDQFLSEGMEMRDKQHIERFGAPRLSTLYAVELTQLLEKTKMTVSHAQCIPNIQASPRAGKPGVIAAARGRHGGAPSKGRRYRKAAAVVGTRGAFQGVKVAADALKRPFAGGTELDALPGRLESLIFPDRLRRCWYHCAACCFI